MELFLSIALAVVFVVFVCAVVLWGNAKTRAAQLRTQLGSESADRAAAEKERDSERKENQTAQIESVKAAARADSAEKTAADLDAQNKTMRGEVTQKTACIAKLETELKNAQQSAAEKIADLQKVHEKMDAEFKNMAQKILEEKSEKFGEESSNLLKPLREELAQFRERVNNIHTKDAEDRSALKQQITDLKNNAAEYGKSADNLARALKGDSKTQGGWGEIMLANLLEKSGLREGEDYETQKTMSGEDGAILRPDVVVNLPDSKRLIIDSKVSLRDFCDAAEAENPDAEKAALSRHADAVKKHVDNLSSKDYARAKGVKAPDFVFMFMEIEPAFFAALRESPELFSDAYNKKIILCAPTTLMATLRTVERIWQLERQNRNAERIARQGGALFDKFNSFIKSMDKIGAALTNARQSYDHAYSQLSKGRGNLISHANKLKDLGVNAKKQRLKEADDEPLQLEHPSE